MAEYGEPLTDREHEILRLVATGVTNREAGYRLGISVNTVKVHLRNIYAKLGAESRTEATMMAVQEGWVLVEGTEQNIASAPAEESLPPFPWTKRVALVAALLFAAASMALTWPVDTPLQEPASNLPLDRSSGQPIEASGEADDSPWQERAHMPTRRAYLALAAVKGRLFAIAGQTPEGITGAVEIYDPEEDIWTRGKDKPTPVTFVSGAAIGADVYVPGGCDDTGAPTRVVEVYDTQVNTWREASPLPEPRCAYALAAADETLYLFGGWDGQAYVATAYVYSPETDSWAETTPMFTKRGFASAAWLGDRLYVVGGYDNQAELATCTALDPGTEQWAPCAPLAIGRGGIGLVSSEGYLYAIGGGGWTSYLGFNERYDVSSDRWEIVETPLVEEWRSPGVAAIEGTIYAIGGWSGDHLSQNQAYDPLPFRVFIPVSQR